MGVDAPGHMNTLQTVMDLIGGVGVPPSPPPPFCDEASQYASQKNPVTAFWVSQYFQKSCFPTMAYCIFCDMSQFTTPPPPPPPPPEWRTN